MRVVTCRGKALQVVQRVPRGVGFESWKQVYEEFEPRPSGEVARSVPSALVASEVR